MIGFSVFAALNLLLQPICFNLKAEYAP